MLKFDPNNKNVHELISLYDEVYEDDIPETHEQEDDDDGEEIIRDGVKLRQNEDGEYCYVSSDDEDDEVNRMNMNQTR